MIRKKRDSKRDNEIFDQYYDMNMVASATSYTGLTPAPPHSVNEAESYSDIYSYPNDDIISEKDKDKKE